MKKTLFFLVGSLMAVVMTAAPIKSNLASREISTITSASMPTAADYVQDGLIAMWDGIENAGWGIHDQNATFWKDLIGNVDLPIGNAIWTAQACSTNNYGNIYYERESSSSIVQSLICGVSNNVYFVENMTIEMCFKYKYSLVASRILFGLSTTSYDSGISVTAPWSSPRIGYVPSFIGGYSNPYRYTQIATILNKVTTLSGTCVKVGENVIANEYFNGLKTANEKNI